MGVDKLKEQAYTKLIENYTDIVRVLKTLAQIPKEGKRL